MKERNTAVIGMQWGDEGKGKVVDYLARRFNVDARFQGGANAGHTVWHGGEKVIFHQIPCGVLNKKITAVIGAGCVLDLPAFFEELASVKKYVKNIEKTVKISRSAHLVMPYHLLIDKIREESNHGIGTTKRGIGQAYEDKYARIGLRVGDLFDAEAFRIKLRANISRKNHVLMEVYHAEPLSEEPVFRNFSEYTRKIEPMVIDDSKFINEAIAAGKKIIFEGAQGSLLDVDFGTYPYVTSSHTIAAGCGIGLGIRPNAVEKVIGVAKAYTTRVGQGPFPTEDKSETGRLLQEGGKEYGSTTGRPRRCGAFDAMVVKYAARLCGAKELFLTKLDVLAPLKKIRIGVGYSNADEFDPFIADRLEPVYEELPGFGDDISRVREYRRLPKPARDYVKFIEKCTGLKVTHVSVGAGRDATIRAR